MRSLGVLLAVVLGATGCGKDAIPPPPIDAAIPRRDLGEIATQLGDEACACPDLPCIEKVQQKLGDLRFTHRFRGDAQPDVKRAVVAASEKLRACAAALAARAADAGAGR